MRLPQTPLMHTNLRRSGSLNKTSLFTALFLLHLTTLWSVEAAPQSYPTNDDEEYRRNDAVEYGAPLITPLMEYVTLELNTNYTIRCEADEPMLWKLPTSYLPEYEVKTFDTGDPQRPYGSMLYLLDISHSALGNYYCVKKSSIKKDIDEMADEELVELVNNNKASSIYIYVNDPVNLLAEIDFPVITAIQYQDTVIPCKPTMPNIEVLLTTPHGENGVQATALCSSKLAPNCSSFPPDNVYDSIGFDPKIGFIVRNLERIVELECFTRNGSTHNSNYSISIDVKHIFQ